jgi:hypothetical protein
MNYDQTIHQLIESLGADKSIPAQYRNSVISSARRLQLEIRGARTMTVQQVPEEVQAAQTPVCNCPAGGIRRDCPVHRGAV